VPVILRTFYAAGINYAAHIREMAEKRGEQPVFPKRPTSATALTTRCSARRGCGDPERHREDQLRGELVVIIGKQAKHLSKADAMSCVFGYTIGNDVSERTWQRGDRTFWRGKNADTFKPWDRGSTPTSISTMQTTVRVNGKDSSSSRPTT
jgi:2-keto-4-pentenoate hydratase/2-oxohepta-3-ene-1,7-dioic acid hydratase in catechol pathway